MNGLKVGQRVCRLEVHTEGGKGGKECNLLYQFNSELSIGRGTALGATTNTGQSRLLALVVLVL